MRKVLQIFPTFDLPLDPKTPTSIDLSLTRDVYDCFTYILSKFESDYSNGVVKSEPLDEEDSNILELRDEPTKTKFYTLQAC